jgi:RNA polymerase sigma factor (sigma-70 family)
MTLKSSNSNYNDNSVFLDFIESENALIDHCLNHPLLAQDRSTLRDLESINVKRFHEDGREVIDTILEKADSLSVEESEWSKSYRALNRIKKHHMTKCIEMHYNIVYHHARRWFRGYRSQEIYSDLIQEGYFGLVKAIVRFNPALGFKFYTYAIWWIRQSMKRYCDENMGIIKVPHTVSTLITSLKKEYTKQMLINGESDFTDIVQKSGTKFRSFEATEIKTMSLDTSVHEDLTLMDTMVSEDISPLEEYECKEMNNLVRELLNLCDDRERTIIQERFGLLDGNPKTLQEIGDNIGLTRERVRQIEEKCLMRFKHRVKESGTKRAQEYFNHGTRLWS